MTSETAPDRHLALRKGAELELAFTDLLANGQAVGRAGRAVVFCSGPLPGERARVRISTVKQRYSVADLIEILAESPLRARPFCPVFGTCGGCQVQHLSYSAQLLWKRSVVREALQRIGGFTDPAVAPAIGMANPRAYRNKMSLVVDQQKEVPALGFYRQRSHDIVAIDACPIVTPKLNADLNKLDALRRDPPVRAMLAESRHLVARSAGASELSLLTITTSQASDAARNAAPALQRAIPGLAGVSNSFELSSANAIIGRHSRVLCGDAEIEEEIGGVRYRVSAGSFFQVNVEMVERIFSDLEPELASPGRIVDLYCGAGTFALFFAKHGWQVEGVEENLQAVAEARANAKRNGLSHCARFTAGRIEELAGTPRVGEAMQAADVVFLDPPRKGCDDVVLEAIVRSRVPVLWYLSCDPATLARDSKFLVAKGYRLGIIQPFDMFPQTGHIEALAHLEYS